MKTYTFWPGSISAVLYMDCDGVITCWVYVNENLVEADKVKIYNFPQEVQRTIVEHFAKVFAKPIDQRDDYLYSLGLFAVNVTE